MSMDLAVKLTFLGERMTCGLPLAGPIISSIFALATSILECAKGLSESDAAMRALAINCADLAILLDDQIKCYGDEMSDSVKNCIDSVSMLLQDVQTFYIKSTSQTRAKRIAKRILFQDTPSKVVAYQMQIDVLTRNLQIVVQLDSRHEMTKIHKEFAQHTQELSSLYTSSASTLHVSLETNKSLQSLLHTTRKETQTRQMSYSSLASGSTTPAPSSGTPLPLTSPDIIYDEPAPMMATKLYNIPTFHVPHFVQRPSLLTQLESLFQPPPSSSKTRTTIIILLGLGGAGKTQLALEYCSRNRDNNRFSSILWVDASSNSSAIGGIQRIAKKLFPQNPINDETVEQVIEEITNWTNDWLMVFDNFDNPSEFTEILRFIPSSKYGHVLFTSRHEDSTELGNVIKVDCMEEEEGLKLLLPKQVDEEEEVGAAKEILSSLGYLALAIDQTRGYMSKRKLKPSTFITEFKARKTSVLKETPVLWHYRQRGSETYLNVLTTWEMSFLHLDDSEGKVLMILAFFNFSAINEDIFRISMEHLPEYETPMSMFLTEEKKWDRWKFEEVLVKMQSLSLLQFSRRGEGKGLSITIHSLVSEWLRTRLDDSTLFLTAMWHLYQYLSLEKFETMEFDGRQETVLHIDTMVNNTDNLQLDKPEVLDQLSAFALQYLHHSRLKDAEKLYQVIFAGREKALGPEDSSTLTTMNLIGDTYRMQGRLDDAERMHKQALAGFENTLGSEHLNTLITLNHLGVLYEFQGRLAESEEMHNRALKGCEKTLGEEHIRTLHSLNNLGILYQIQGRLEEAQEMHRRALAVCEKINGPGHASTFGIINNISLLYQLQGRHDEAITMCQRALEGKERVLGPSHMSTLNTANNLGVLYQTVDRLSESEEMHNRALAGFEITCGSMEHAYVLETFNNLGLLYVKQGRLDEAEGMYEKALVGREKKLGVGHKRTVETVRNLGALYEKQGRTEKAEEMFARARESVKT